MLTKTISVNNSKIIISSVDINRINTHVRRSDMTLTSIFLPSIYPLPRNLPLLGLIFLNLGGKESSKRVNFKPNLFAFRLEIRPKFCVANFRNPIFSFFLLKFLYNISFESNFCMVYQVDLIRANKHKIEITKGILKVTLVRTSHS